MLNHILIYAHVFFMSLEFARILEKSNKKDGRNVRHLESRARLADFAVFWGK